ncbi:transcriptional regulator cAMP-binding AadR/Crp/Fnr [Acidisphaera rubrifaciens HS-AP3]|uniref:Transcriptional regulator cAMP-binding AadR/Crp/Fnr n=2 Tax=Acidisphaera TaxID=50714 RepID=A0A0D6P6L1_9PROT|nr:transcriptional regulator cAMP-binding AadR/Crp/Fnr [Acidisphaera rubrifaciens HS-AP3]
MRMTSAAAGESRREPCAYCQARPHSLCSAVPDDALSMLATLAVVRDYAKGQVFIEQGAAAEDFFNVTSGTVKLYKLLPDGRQQITGFAGTGHFLGLAVTDTYTFSVQAIEPVRACRFSRSRLRRLMDDCPQVEERLLRTACQELIAAQEQILLLGRKSAQERLATFLLGWSRQADPRAPPAERVRLPMTRGDIADHLGLTIETVSRTFSRFRADGRIRTPSSHEVVITDRPYLERLAAGAV